MEAQEPLVNAHFLQVTKPTGQQEVRVGLSQRHGAVKGAWVAGKQQGPRGVTFLVEVVLAAR